MNETSSIPLLYDGDAYVISLSAEGATFRLVRLLRTSGNGLSEPEIVSFFSLGESARGEVLRQIQRRHPGSTVRV